MKIVKLDLDYLMGPIFGDVYSVELHKSITGIKIIDDDRILQQLHDKIQDMFFSYYEFNKNGQACWFNKEQQRKEKDVMMDLLGKLKARLDEINDGSFVIEDHETERLKSL